MYEPSARAYKEYARLGFPTIRGNANSLKVYMFSA